MPSPRRYSILIINPNITTYMTDAVKPIVDNLSYNDIDFEYFTAPEKPDTVVRGLGGEEIKGIPSIDNGEDSANSALYCLPSLKPLVPKHDAFLVACYSADPLVGMLKGVVREYAESRGERCRKYVTGIFEASVAASLALVWEKELSGAVMDMLSGPSGERGTSRFAGVETTGLTAIELHSTPADEVHRRLRDATERLVTKSEVGAICLGCGGMAGMGEAVREGCLRALGPARGSRVRVVDGIVAGVGMLVNACKGEF